MAILIIQLSTGLLLWQYFAILEFILKIYSLYILFKQRKRYRSFLFVSFLMIFLVPFFGSLIFLITNTDINKNRDLT